MSSPVEFAVTSALSALEGVSATHPVHLLWAQSPNQKNVWAVFEEHCGSEELNPDAEATQIFFWEQVARLCERAKAGGEAALAEENLLRGKMGLPGRVSGGSLYKPSDHYPDARPWSRTPPPFDPHCDRRDEF